MSRLRAVLALGMLAVVAAFAGCSKEPPPAPPPPPVQPTPPPPPPPPPFKVTGMDLGKAKGIDNKVAAPMSSFGPKDTIYLSVVSDGVAPAVALKAKWTYGAKNIPVKEESVSVASLGPHATAFPLTKPSGLPTGTYRVELFVDDKSAGVKEFTVAAGKAPTKKK
jgi:hypothetical protein